MLLSAEIRLFWFDNKPADLENWFMNEAVHRCAAGGPEERTDIYLSDPHQTELGVKTRGEKPGVEVKGLIATLNATIEIASYKIPTELWSKWSSSTLGFDPKTGVKVHKKRWLRKFDTTGSRPAEVPRDRMPPKGCNVEWTIVETPPGETCWTLGFEAFGKLDDVEDSLRSVAAVIRYRNPPPSPGAQSLSYPEWLANRAKST